MVPATQTKSQKTHDWKGAYKSRDQMNDIFICGGTGDYFSFSSAARMCECANVDVNADLGRRQSLRQKCCAVMANADAILARLGKCGKEAGTKISDL